MSSTETSEIKAPRELKDKKRRRAVKAEPRSCPESKKWRASSTVAAAGGDSSKPVCVMPYRLLSTGSRLMHMSVL